MSTKPATLAVFTNKRFVATELTTEQRAEVGKLLASYCTQEQCAILSSKKWVTTLTIESDQ